MLAGCVAHPRATERSRITLAVKEKPPSVKRFGGNATKWTLVAGCD